MASRVFGYSRQVNRIVSGLRYRASLAHQFPHSWRWILKSRRIAGYLTDREADGLHNLARSVSRRRDCVVVEIGSFQGKSSLLLAAGLQHNKSARLYCVDPFGQDENPDYQAKYYDPLLRPGDDLLTIFESNMRRHGLRDYVVPLKGYSFEKITDWRVPIDLLFIDGNHEYDCVRRDFSQWSPYVREGGIIAFHDANGTWPGPSKVVEESLRPPEFGPPIAADSLVWATRYK